MEFCSCSWQPATPEGNSSLRLPTREPCPCRVELDGAQTESSPPWKQDRAVCATTEPHAQGSGNACGGSQSCSQPLSLHCTKPAPKPPLLLHHTGCTQQGKFSWTITTTEVLMDQDSHTCWSHPHSHGCLKHGITTFTGPGTRREPGMGEETVTPNPSCMKNIPSQGSHRAMSPASTPCHELATQTLGSSWCCDKEMLPCSPRKPRQ